MFSPDGKRLAWTSNRTASKQSQIFWADWNDAAARRLLGLDGKSPVADVRPLDSGIGDTGAAISADDARLHVRRLAADDMAGRLTGSEGERLATAYVATVFKHLGLEPAGDDGTWFQSFPFTAGASLGADNVLTVEGLDAAAPLIIDQDWRPLALSRNGSVEAADVVFAGYGIVAPGSETVPDYDAYGDLDVRDKWVMVLRFLPESVPPAWRRHLLHYSDLAYKAAVAKRRGALGLIVVTGPQAQARQRLVELDIDGGTTSIAGLSISDELGAAMLASSGQDLGALQAALDKGEVGEGVLLEGIRVAADIDVKRKQAKGRNVIARLPASAPGELPPVIVGAHVDHLGHGRGTDSLAREDEREQVHPGADDNASGVAAMLEVAQYLADLRARGKLGAKRDLLFVAWSGEELGTLGSGHFVEQLAGDDGLRGKVSAYLNMDMVGHLREKLYLQGTGSSKLWAREIERRNVPVGLAIATKADPYLPTDVTPFYMQGVPVLNAFTGAHENYSSPRDTADQLNYEGLRDTARLMAGIARSLARSDSEPDYVEVERSGGGMSRKHLRAYLGTIPAYGQDENVKGVKLQGAVKNGPAEKAGIINGDILTGLGDVEVENIQDFMSALAGLRAGEPTTLRVSRDGKTLTLDVVPGTRE